MPAREALYERPVMGVAVDEEDDVVVRGGVVHDVLPCPRLEVLDAPQRVRLEDDGVVVLALARDAPLIHVSEEAADVMPQTAQPLRELTVTYGPRCGRISHLFAIER